VRRVMIVSVPELAYFSPATRQWFTTAFAAPTAAQQGAWQAIAAGRHVLVVAPTGSGKTLAAFLWALDRLAVSPPPREPSRRCRVLYVSPLKALAVDVERNLRTPLTGIQQAAHRLNLPRPDIRVGLRTGDTPVEQRRAFARTPPDVLVTTPESLYLLLTSAARESLRGIDTVIVDEVHAVAATKRGAHLALSLERLDALLPSPAQRIGLSATVRPVEEISVFLAGGRPVQVVQPVQIKTVEIAVQVPVADMSALGEDAAETQVSDATRSDHDRASIWPAVETEVLNLVLAHRSTIVFVNSRRLAERLTARLNELAAGCPAASRDRMPAELMGQAGLAGGAPEVVARAHHGSMSRERRTIVEEELKSGRLRCVVATSSLELGIDMGAVDLVVHVEAPPTVASGLQRIGRAGHQVGAISRGVIFPKFRGDLVACAVVAERMANAAIEAVRFPRNPLDVLAQQVVAMVAMDCWTVDELSTLVRRAAPYATLPDSALHAVLDMLAGRYPSEKFAELRPRILWDRVSGELRGRPGAQRLAVTSGGTIPDRGLFTVMTPSSVESSGSRVGELDEEMVYESRVGDTFLLGSTSWKIVDITHDRVIAQPVPGEPARMPFWKGDAPGRPLELGQALGAFIREVGNAGIDRARRRLQHAGLDTWATDNLLSYLREQREATGHLPDDRTVVVERFRDELGDWRMVVHSPFGAPVNGPWALALGARLRERWGITPQLASADDGIVIRLPDAVDAHGMEVLPTAEDVLLEPDQIEQLVTAEVGSSALFASRFRECAARSLLLPRRDPRHRSPLWQQRQRSAQLLAVASKYEQFPIVLETMRECLQDVYDLAGLRELMSEVRARRVRVVEVVTPSPSPFARSLLFGYVGMFLYELDAPLAERKAAALALDTTLLTELLGSEALRELLDSEVLIAVEAQLQRLTPERQARDQESAAELLRTLGDLTNAEAAQRGITPEWLAELSATRRAITVRIAGENRWISIEDAGRMRDALGVALPVGVPEAFTEPVADPLADLLLRYARTRGPFTATAAAERFGLGVAVVGAALERLMKSGLLVRGELRPVELGGTGVEYCHADVLRRLRRASLARLRAEVEPVEQSALGRFLPAWHGIEPTHTTADAPGRRQHRSSPPTPEELLAVVEQLAGAPVPASALESLLLPARLPGYSPGLLDELTISGEVTWVGCGSLTSNDGWIALAPTDVADLVLPDVDEQLELGPVHRCLLRTLGWESGGSVTAGGALFFRHLADRTAQCLLAEGKPAPSDLEVVGVLWDLVWAGLITNDSLAPLRALVSGRSAIHRPPRPVPRGRFARMRARRPPLPSRAGPPAAAGRWSLASPREPDPTRRAHARAEVFLERHGVLTRGALETERLTGGFAGIYKVLRAMEESGRCRRGYVIEGLGAAQFAIAGAIDRLRVLSQLTTSETTAVVLAATDPAQPYGAALPWPQPVGEVRHRPGRKAGALSVLVNGEAILYVERGGRSLLSFTEDLPRLRAAVHALAGAVRRGWLGSISVERADGEAALGSTLAELLRDAGFRATPRGLRLRPEQPY
jgi:ATP-dependent Lhr-like helicase